VYYEKTWIFDLSQGLSPPVMVISPQKSQETLCHVGGVEAEKQTTGEEVRHDDQSGSEDCED
jgi:hypothetical protein